MQKFEAKHFLAIAGAIVLIVLLIIAPRTPEKEEEPKTVSVDQKIEKAVLQVQQGENPLQGILQLREVLEEDSTNVDALWHLAMFSLESNQLENAVKRFRQLTEYDQSDPPKYEKAWVYLGQTYASLGDTVQSRNCLEKYLAVATSDAEKRIVKDMLESMVN